MKYVTAVAAIGLASLSLPAQGGITIGSSAHAFVDISASGTSVVPPGALCDDCEYIITAAALTAAGFAGNGLLAGGVAVDVGNNGGIVWNPAVLPNGTTATGDQVGYINAAPPTPLATMAINNTTVNGNGNGARQFLAVLWDDNFPGAAGPSVKWQVIGGNLIIQWTNEDHFNAQGTGTVTYEAIIYGGVSIASGAPLVEYVYNDTLFAASQYQNDGGSATVGYKNWGVNASANDVEFGTGGGTNALADPAFGGTNMQPKVGGWASASDAALPHSVVIRGVVACDSADFDCDGDTATDADIEAFFRCVAGTCPAAPCTNSADFNHDGDSATDADIEAFFRVLAGGTC